ncbi:MAG TPA: GNAT family N-acetyltransferase [Casimicrobiaceae bacterium]|nr:GNAT family N-acetyltransferase [Casimicrobiaceae bacterium]
MRCDAARIEEAALNALQTQQQLFFDGWLVRLSPGKAKRGRSVNPHFGSSLPLEAKIERCERLYASRRLPALFRITPFAKPGELDDVLAQRGYVAFDRTLVQVAGVASPPMHNIDAPVAIEEVPIEAFARAAGKLRGSSTVQTDAHLERLAHSPLAPYAIVARMDGHIVGCGQLSCEDGIAGVYDMVTAPEWRERGVATAIVTALLANARERGATCAFLQVDEHNEPALGVYRKFGFATAYVYHYRGRPGECK